MIDYYRQKDSTYMYVVVAEDENEVRARHVLRDYMPNAVIDFPAAFKREEFDQLVDSGELIWIHPPTFYIVTTRNTFKIKDKLKSAGAIWNSIDQFWYFKEEPSKNLCRYKEVYVYPFTGKRI